jgi:uncharacterized protein (TIGR03000 family)
MYSLVLMAALTSGTSAPDGWFSHSHGGHGCHGYACAGCAGYYGGGAGWGCTGCYGGSYYGSWYGGGNGCYGCYGGSWGYGGGWGLDYNCFGCHGCYGCAGTFTCGGYLPPGGGQPPELIPPPKVEEKKGGTGALAPDRAKVIVQLPADAKLYVDEQPIKASAERQTFSTPRLERGQTYFYDVRVEAVRDGKTVVDSKRILVRAGEEVTVSFPKLDTPPAGIAAADPPRRR